MVQKGQRVTVTFPDSVRESKTATVVKVPPWTEHMCGNTYTRTDSVLVEYPGTGRGGLFGNMRERIPLDRIVP